MQLNGSVPRGTIKQLNKMLTIKAEADAGTTVEKAFKEAEQMAKKLGCYVEFQFNDILCCASPKGNYSEGVRNYFTAVKNKAKFCFDF